MTNEGLTPLSPAEAGMPILRALANPKLGEREVLIESVNDTLKGQLELERRGGRSAGPHPGRARRRRDITGRVSQRPQPAD